MDIEQLLKQFKITKAKWLRVSKAKWDECNRLVNAISRSLKEEEKLDSIEKDSITLSRLLKEKLVTEDSDNYNIPNELRAVIIFELFANDFKRIADLSEKISFLNEFHRKILRIELDSKYLSIFLIELDNQNNGLIKSLVEKSIMSDDVFSFYHRFCDTIPFIDIKDYNWLIDTLIALKEKTYNDLSSGTINQSLKKRIKVHKTEGALLFDLIRKKKKGYELMGDILHEIFLNDRDNGFNKITDIISNGNNDEIRAGLECLGRIDINDSKNKNYLNSFRDLILNIYSNKDEDLYPAIVYSSFNFYEYDNNLAEVVLEISKCDNQISLYAIAAQLNLSLNLIKSDNRFQESFLNLSNVHTSSKGTISRIDSILYQLAQDVPEFVADFFKLFQLSRKEVDLNEGNSLSSHFSSSFRFLLINNSAIRDKMITEWCAAKDFKLHKELSSLLMESKQINSEENLKPKFQKILLDKYSDREIEYMARKAIGYIYDGYALCSLMFSLFTRNRIDQYLYDLVFSFFEEYLLDNYLGTVKKFLETEQKTFNKIQREFSIQLTKRIDNRFQKLKALEFLNEFRVPSFQKNRVLRESSKRSRRYMDKAEQKSPLLGVISKKPIKYGRKFTALVEGNFTSSGGMNKYSASFEIPKNELIDPIGNNIYRINNRFFE